MLLLHLSDIHFHTNDIDRPFDPNLGLRDDMMHDLKIMISQIRRPIDAILISGDIAYHGRKDEYDFAFQWLRDTVCPLSGCMLENVFVIPGNHDVDRNATKAPAHEAARRDLRAIPKSRANTEIAKYMNDTLSSQMLFGPIENYNRFAANFFCETGRFEKESGRKPYACRDFELNDHSKLRVWGFNSVLICDANDNVNMMYVDPSAAQIEREDGVTHLVMCHHPFNWLRNDREFRGRIEAVALIQLFGHEHNFRVDDHRDFTRICAGALQPERDEEGWQPGYNIIDVSVSAESQQRYLDLVIWVRHWQDNRFIPVPDRRGIDPWKIRHVIPNWTQPSSAIVSTASEVPPPAPDAVIEVPPMSAPAPSMRTVALKMMGLRPFDQHKIITKLDLYRDGDHQLRDYELALAAVRRASEQGELQKLTDAIDNYDEGETHDG